MSVSGPSARSGAALLSGAAVGTLGGLIGLGGAEFRLPLLIGLFGFGALPAVILNKALSLVVVASALPSRATAVPFASVLERWDVVVTLLAGSVVGAWVGAGWATKVSSTVLQHTLAILLLLVAAALIWGHGVGDGQAISLTDPVRLVAGVTAGFGVGIIAAIMGVAGGELLIPAIILLFGVDVKVAGSLSLAISLPTMIVGFTRYSLDSSFSIIHSERRFLLFMAVGSVIGAFVGGRLLGHVPSNILLPVLAFILLISAFKLWVHKGKANVSPD